MPPAGDLLLVAEDALERAGELRDEDRDGEVLNFPYAIVHFAFKYPIPPSPSYPANAR